MRIMVDDEEQVTGMQRALEAFAELRAQHGADGSTREFWAYLGMAIVLWVTWRSAGDDVELALKFGESFGKQLRENIYGNIGPTRKQ